MVQYDRGPLREYEIQWGSGYFETVRAHRVDMPVTTNDGRPRHISFYGDVDGRFRLVLVASEDDIRTIRDITTPERIQEAEERR